MKRSQTGSVFKRKRLIQEIKVKPGKGRNLQPVRSEIPAQQLNLCNDTPAE